jgi:hexosaminidase
MNRPLAALSVVVALAGAVYAAPAEVAVVPAPASLAVSRAGAFLLERDTQVVADDGARAVGEAIAGFLRPATGFPIPVMTPSTRPARSVIRLRLDPAIADGEGYRLRARPLRVDIEARTPAGLFYAGQTLRQLLPVAISSARAASGVVWRIPAVDVADAPRFPYRGMHLDVSRHFFPVDFVKRYIDLLAAYKINTFHWHLTDDQGWRIEIRKYPRLTEVGAWRAETQSGVGEDSRPIFDGRRHGGFYTQDEVREIVRYAADRFVTIVPEIDMPGHALAALAAYPELACTPGPFAVATTFGVFDDVLCPTDRTAAFMEDVLAEVTTLFPGPLVHIGGDEVPKTRWQESAAVQEIVRREGLRDEEQLQGLFMKRMAAFLAKHERQAIGWDEIMEGGLPPGAAVMSWRGASGASAAKEGHDIVMAPYTFTYFNLREGEEKRAGGGPGGQLTLEKVYAFEPMAAGLDADAARHILGGQGNLWTEWLAAPADVERTLLPRLLAMSEVLWSPAAARDWPGFAVRVRSHLRRFDRAGVEYGRHFFAVRQSHEIDAAGGLRVTLAANTDDPVHYTLDGSEPTAASARYTAPLRLEKSATVRAVAVRDGRPLEASSARAYTVNLALGRPVQYTFAFSETYAGDREHALTSGRRGGRSYSDGWQGFDATDFEATLDLGEARTLRRTETAFMRDVGSWVFLPRRVEFLVSPDGRDFTRVGEPVVIDVDRAPAPIARTVEVAFAPVTARYVRVRAENAGSLPGCPGAGGRPWIFVDQLVVE